VTVYRHFADEAALARACSGRYFERHPPPDPESWREIADPWARLRAGLAEAYAYHRRTEAMMSHVLADARDHEVMSPYHAYWRRAVEVLAAPFRARGARRAALEAGLALAVSFDAWRTLARDRGLTDAQAAEVAARLAGAPGGATPGRRAAPRRAAPRSSGAPGPRSG
jgi:AcrR family transcriptional regulator